MRLISFRIKNFKSIIDTGECHLSKNDNILVLAGQNEAGKNAVLEALDFFRNGPQPDFERLFRRQNTNPEIVCTFELELTDIDNILNETQNENLKKYLIKNRVLSFRRGDINGNDFGKILLVNEDAEKLDKFFTTTEEGNEKNEAEPVSGTEENKSSINSLDKLEEFLLVELRKFVFYDSFADLLPGELLISEIANHQAVLDFQGVFRVNFADIAVRDTRAIWREEQRLHKEASDNLNTYWTQKLEEGGRYNFSVKIIPHESTPKIQFMIDRDDGDPLHMEQKSKGFRWFSAFNLKLRALGVNEAVISNLVILIDEPGQGLHEKAQRNVKKVIEELAEKGAQIVYATHYPSLIGTEGREFARIRIVSNTKQFGTKVETVAQFAARADQGAKDSLSPLITAMGIHSAGSLLDVRRLNVVVEGISDHFYLTAFKKLLNKDDRLYFLPACGVNNVPNLVSVLIGWGCNYKAVFDSDPKSGRLAYNLLKREFYENDDNLSHQHILKIRDCDGIEDIFGPKDFYKFVLNESFLGGSSKDKNSKLAEVRKELLARLFLERVENNEIKLSQTSINKIEEVFNWLYEKFNIT